MKLNNYRNDAHAWASQWLRFLRHWGAYRAPNGQWRYPTSAGFSDAAELFWSDLAAAYPGNAQDVLELTQDLLKEDNL